MLDRIKSFIISLLEKEFFRFAIVGGLSALCHYLVYLFLQMYIDLTWSYALAYGISLVFNYFLTAGFTFRKKTNLKNTIGFLLSHAINYLNHMVFFSLFIYIGVNKFIAPILVLIIAVPINFLLLRYVFNNKRFT